MYVGLFVHSAVVFHVFMFYDATEAHQIINKKQSQNGMQHKAEKPKTIVLDKAMYTTDKKRFLMEVSRIFRQLM